jgi:RHS repeat-associated protein
VGDSLIYSTNESRVLQTENVLDLGGQIVASKRFTNPDTSGTPQPYANKYYLYSYDIRGSVSNIIGPDGNLVTGYEYDAFGNKAQTGDGSFINDVTYTGSVSDDGSGLQYMNARFYQPETGRFLSQDTYTGVAADPRTQNLYSYCGSNPINFVDPTGHARKQIGTTGIWIDEGAYRKLQLQANQLGLNPEEIWKAGSASGLSAGQTKSIKEAAHKAEQKQKARESKSKNHYFYTISKRCKAV